MFTYRAGVLYTSIILCLVLAACTTAPGAQTTPTPIPTRKAPTPTVSIPSPTPTPAHVLGPTPQHYNIHFVLRGVGRPDDLAFDRQGHLLFSDFYNGTVSRINANGSVTVLQRGLAGPEGLAVLSDGTLIIAEQRTNRILSLAPHASFPTILRMLPGTPSSESCKDGVDGITFDPTNNTLIIPDSPTGAVYRMSLDGKTLTLLASGITRPVGAAVDAQGNVYVADECGGALWRIAPDGKATHLNGFGMLDDVALDAHGNLLVTDLAPAIHALIRIDATTDKREPLVSRGLIEPQGLAIDGHDNIFVSDDYADIIMELTPA